MLESLGLSNVGPSPRMDIEFARRMNIFTGDNGLGKSFILDVAWWVLTRTWSRSVVMPRELDSKAAIHFRYTKTKGSYHYESTFDRKSQTWSVQQGRPPIPGLVIYAQVDGGFSVWDPARNYWRKDSPERPASYLFSAGEVWQGNAMCEGLIRDWASWQREGNTAFKRLRGVLETLSPSAEETLEPGALRRVFLDDPKQYPTLKTEYGPDVPVVHASAGVRRILAFAYLLVWAWESHIESSALLGQSPAREVVLMIDEIEAHLHPRWQRRIVPAVLTVIDSLTQESGSKVQIIAATHSPLVMASLEPHFDEDIDQVFHLNVVNSGVVLDRERWAMQGDVLNWLVSDSFGLAQARSIEAEQAIETAEAFMRGDTGSAGQGMCNRDEIDKELRKVLAGNDPFWPRWIVKAFPEVLGR